MSHLFFEISGSPFTCQVIDSRQVRVSGEGKHNFSTVTKKGIHLYFFLIGLEKIAINRPASFNIDISGQPSTLDVRVLSPSRRVIPSVIESVSESRYSVEYIPTEVGKSA